MSQTSADVAESTETGTVGDQPSDTTAPEALVVEELLVEEVSIDGMCGVY